MDNLNLKGLYLYDISCISPLCEKFDVGNVLDSDCVQ